MLLLYLIAPTPSRHQVDQNCHDCMSCTTVRMCQSNNTTGRYLPWFGWGMGYVTKCFIQNDLNDLSINSSEGELSEVEVQGGRWQESKMRGWGQENRRGRRSYHREKVFMKMRNRRGDWIKEYNVQKLEEAGGIKRERVEDRRTNRKQKQEGGMKDGGVTMREGCREGK